MKTKLIIGLFLSLLTGTLLTGQAGALTPKHAPLVSTAWLMSHHNQADLVIIDIRSASEYEAGHIANAINLPFAVPVSAWSASRDELLLEVPGPAELFRTIGSCGITRNSRVVIVTSGPAAPPYPLANAARVATTLIYAGVDKVAILDGGHAKWQAEGKPVITEVPVVKPVPYAAKLNRQILVSKEYLQKRLRKAVILDARDAAVYHGSAIEPWADKPGHIPTARSLPAPMLWNPDGTYQSPLVLRQMVNDVLGKQHPKELIVYCGVGGYGSCWWYVLTQVLGYKNVKLYDGAAQEWVRYFDMETN